MMSAFLWWMLGVASFLPLMIAMHAAVERFREGLAERAAAAAFRHLRRVVSMDAKG